MADIELVIKIDEDAYKEIKKIVADGNEMCFMQKLIANGIPFEDVKVEIQNTILEQTYEKGQIDKLETIKAEIIEYRDNEANDIDFEIGAINDIIVIIDKHIAELKGENK